MFVEFEGYRPRVSATAFVAPTAVLVGNVVVHDDASIWYGAVLRADRREHGIVIGARSNVQDNSVIHVPMDRGTVIGEGVTIGHGVIMEGCDIEDGALIGMNAVVLEHARVGARTLLAAGSTVLAHTSIPPDSVAAGSPAVVKKALEGRARQWIETAAEHYMELGRRYREAGLGVTS